MVRIFFQFYLAVGMANFVRLHCYNYDVNFRSASNFRSSFLWIGINNVSSYSVLVHNFLVLVLVLVHEYLFFFILVFVLVHDDNTAMD